MPESAPTQRKDFFISYNKADRTAAEWIAWQLEEEGKYTVVIQAWDFGPGCNFIAEMDRAVQECDRVLAVLSPDYLTSLYTKPEWMAYFVHDPIGTQRRILPVRVRECEFKGLLAPIVYTDLVGKEEADATLLLLEDVRKILAIAETGRDKPKRKPDFFGRPPRAIPSKPRFFGALPDIWNIPHLRNPNFTEPGDRLAEMRAALQSGKAAALTQALAGLGGMGKTQLAVEYAYRHAGDYTLVWWLRSEQPAALAAEYAALAQKLDLPEKDAQEQPAIIAAVHDALRHRRDWLLVFDNANTPEEIRGYLPGAGGHVLITSRHAAWGGIAQKVEVKKWPSGVAVEFLLKRLGKTDGPSAQVDAAAAADIARELDCLPLALEQAAAYIESTGGTLAGYLTLFKKHHVALLKHGKPGTDYPATVATTWEISFQQLERESPAGAALLHLCAFLAPDDIPRDIIAAGAEHLPEPLRAAAGDALAFDEAVAAIRRYSLIETGGDSTLSLHRLVQAVIRDRLDKSGCKQWAESAVKVVNEAFPNDSEDVLTWKDCDRLLPHAVATADFAENLDVVMEIAARLINQMGAYAWGRAEYDTAKAAFERALKIDEKAFGPDHPNVAIRVNNLGTVLQALGDFPGAKAAVERALRIDEKVFGPDHPNVAIRVNNLGNVLQALGDLPGAKTALERALRMGEKTLGPDHPSVAIRINNLGTVLKDLGDLPGAKSALERALRMDEKALGPDHPNVAIRVNNLGNVLRDLGDLPGAKAAFERALAIFRKYLGDDHPNTKVVRAHLESLPPLP